MSNITKQHLEVIAVTTLEAFEMIAAAAKEGLSQPIVSPESVMANPNTLTSARAIRNLESILDQNRASLRHLSDEPAIARIVAIDDKGEQRTLFVCRTTPVSILDQKVALASYRSPVGRLAALPVGDGVQLPNGEMLHVAERAILRPTRDGQEWDSRQSVLHGDAYGPLTVDSLRALLPKERSEDLDAALLDRLLEQDLLSTNIVEGIRRTVLTRMELRDQPILDEFQDRIFRLPLDSSLLLLGPPGTGKTTTLIRRLGQKLDIQFLTEDEQSIIDTISAPDITPHSTSWLMFTPTALLQQYVKESFSREGIPASDKHVRTWNDYRRELARNAFGMLRTPVRRRGFVLQDTVDYLSEETVSNLTDWFDDFNEWQKENFVSRLRNDAEQLVSRGSTGVSERGRRFVSLLDADLSANLLRIFRACRERYQEIQVITRSLSGAIDSTIRDALILQVNRNNDFLDELATFLDSENDRTQGPLDDWDVQNEEEREDEEDEEPRAPRTGRKGAEIAFRRAAIAQARAAASGRPLRRGTATERLIEWIGDRGIAAPELMNVGENALVRASLRSFLNPARMYTEGIVTRYRAYRRARQSIGQWYRNGSNPGTNIHALELDMLLLAVLRGTRELMNSGEVRRDLEHPFWAILRTVADSYRNQIFVDEATDFSPVQLGCMLALSHPATSSFFACGDFNQRLTLWGARSNAEIAWVDSKMEIEELTIGYRQSRELNTFARQLVRIAGGAEQDVVLPEYADRHGVPPVLVENTSSRKLVAKWLADRIVEIESFTNQLPSIAILVPEESEVQIVASEVEKALKEQNVNVVACPNGQAIGQDNDVRVFDAQHIKGLEFEAVFFVDVDRLAEVYPLLYDKFLYVGATRAATYLGLTCSGILPGGVAELRSMFSAEWGESIT